MKFEFFGKEYESEDIDYIQVYKNKNKKDGTRRSFIVCIDGVRQYVNDNQETNGSIETEWLNFLNENSEKLGFIKGGKGYFSDAFLNVNNACKVFLQTTKWLKKRYLTLYYYQRTPINNSYHIFPRLITEKVSRKNNKWDLVLEEYNNKLKPRYIDQGKIIKDYDLIKYCCAQLVQNGKKEIDMDVLVKALYTLTNELAGKTKYTAVRSIKDTYYSIDINMAASQLNELGILSKYYDGYKCEINLSEQDCKYLLENISKDKKNIIDKICSRYEEIDKIQSNILDKREIIKEELEKLKKSNNNIVEEELGNE